MKSSEPKLTIMVAETELLWSVRHWPLWCGATNSPLGLSLLVESVDGKSRTLIIEFPFKWKTRAYTLHHQRPKISDAEIVCHIEEAIRRGWRPGSRGKPFILYLDAEA